MQTTTYIYIPVHLEHILCQVLASYSTHRCVNRAKSLNGSSQLKSRWSFTGFKFSFEIYVEVGLFLVKN